MNEDFEACKTYLRSLGVEEGGVIYAILESVYFRGFYSGFYEGRFSKEGKQMSEGAGAKDA